MYASTSHPTTASTLSAAETRNDAGEV
uniref:Uncharacterized protein n=1 Tax=Arundo donax TaxID=35708 RepID=A0A0A8YNL0_ARUDO